NPFIDTTSSPRPGSQLGCIVGITLDRVGFRYVEIVFPLGDSVRPVQALNETLAFRWIAAREYVYGAFRAGAVLSAYGCALGVTAAIGEEDFFVLALEHESRFLETLRP